MKIINIEKADKYNSCAICNQEKDIVKLVITESNNHVSSRVLCREHLQQAVTELNEQVPQPELDDWHKQRRERYETCHKELFEKINECRKLVNEMFGVAEGDNISKSRAIQQIIFGIQLLK